MATSKEDMQAYIQYRVFAIVGEAQTHVAILKSSIERRMPPDPHIDGLVTKIQQELEVVHNFLQKFKE